MKRFFRIIVPMILLIAVLLSLCWYFLVYDQAFTKELLLRQARYYESNNKHKAAAWFYDIAYYQSSQDDDVAIELADQYRKAGNYTKAEYTLAQAISQNPSAALYTALSNVYVAQDKLMDAVNMLDTVNNTEIRAQLEAARPAAPVLTPESGFFTQYIDVSAEHTGGTLYLTTDGEYPSILEDLFTGPVSLPLGETPVMALVVGKNGLVSPLTVGGYTVGGVIEPVTFTDAAVDASVRTILEYDENDVIYTSDLWQITSFTLPSDAKTCEDLVKFTHLAVLSGSDLTFDLTPLALLTTLQELNLYNCNLNTEELSAIGSLTGLQRLTLSNCGLSTVSPLEKLTGRTDLDLNENSVRNISPLSRMRSLAQLHMRGNALVSLDALADLTQLEVLDISYNSVLSLAPLAACSALKELNAENNRISTTSELGSFFGLTSLNLKHNELEDVASLSAYTKLEVLNLADNKLTDISSLSPLTALRQLDFSNNQVEALPAFDPSCDLVTINGSHNLITDLQSLSGLPRLNTVSMDYNPELESLKPLDRCHVLIKVNAYGTKVTEVSFLTAKSIIVNFDPTQK